MINNFFVHSRYQHYENIEALRYKIIDVGVQINLTGLTLKTYYLNQPPDTLHMLNMERFLKHLKQRITR